MGAWSAAPFGNDTALDWVGDLTESEDSSDIDAALAAVSDDEYVDSDVACEAVAACEVMARALGTPTDDAEEGDLAEWLEQTGFTPSDAQKAAGVAALERICGDDSELTELWADSNESDDWSNSLRRLVDTLS